MDIGNNEKKKYLAYQKIAQEVRLEPITGQIWLEPQKKLAETKTLEEQQQSQQV